MKFKVPFSPQNVSKKSLNMTSYKFSFLLLLLLACAVAFICPACVSQTPTPQYADNLSFAVAYTHDDVNAMTSAPIEEEVRAALDQVLSKRNLKVAPIAFDSIKPQLEAIRDTDRRIQALMVRSSFYLQKFQPNFIHLFRAVIAGMSMSTSRFMTW